MLNKVILIGNVGQDPEVKDTQAGVIAHCSLATNERYKDKSGAVQNKTEWHRLTFFHPLAEVVNQYVHKGDTIYVEGKITSSEYTDKDGNKKTSVEIQVRDMKMLGGRKDDSNQQSQPSQPPKTYGAGYAPQPSESDPPF